MNDELISVGLFIDGGYYAKIDEKLREKYAMRLDMGRLQDYIRDRIAERKDVPFADCQITESHYFRGRFKANDANDKNILLTERKFEDMLIENDVVFHYKHLREVHKKGGNTVIEKGIDVWYALETNELACIRNFDFVVLITGDADHEMLARKLKAMKTCVLLLTWNLGDHTSTSRFLQEEASWHIELSAECAADSQLLKMLCKPAQV